MSAASSCIECGFGQIEKFSEKRTDRCLKGTNISILQVALTAELCRTARASVHRCILVGWKLASDRLLATDQKGILLKVKATSDQPPLLPIGTLWFMHI